MRIRTAKTAAWPHTKIARRQPAGHLDEADDEAAERRAGDVADPAEDGRGERLEAGLEARG